MKKLIDIYLLFVLITVITISVKSQESLSNLYAQIKPSVVSIVTFESDGERKMSGSGFFVGANQIITNKHVVAGSNNIKIYLSDKQILKVTKILSVDETGDLALLEVELPNPKTKPLVLANYSPKEGEKILVVGNPLGLEGSISDGIVSAFRNSKDEGKLIQITAPISPGSSGSPVVNLRGDVVGVATMNLEGGQNLNFAISSERVISLWSNIIKTSTEKPNYATSPVKKRNATLSRNSGKQLQTIDFSKIYEDEWFNYTSSKYLDFFLNPSTGSKAKNIVRIWGDFRDKTDGEIISKALMEVDCNSQKLRSITETTYYKWLYYPDGRQEKFTIAPQEEGGSNAPFRFFTPGTAEEVLVKVVCKL